MKEVIVPLDSRQMNYVRQYSVELSAGVVIVRDEESSPGAGDAQQIIAATNDASGFTGHPFDLFVNAAEETEVDRNHNPKLRRHKFANVRAVLTQRFEEGLTIHCLLADDRPLDELNDAMTIYAGQPLRNLLRLVNARKTAAADSQTTREILTEQIESQLPPEEDFLRKDGVCHPLAPSTWLALKVFTQIFDAVVAIRTFDSRVVPWENVTRNGQPLGKVPPEQEIVFAHMEDVFGYTTKELLGESFPEKIQITGPSKLLPKLDENNLPVEGFDPVNGPFRNFEPTIHQDFLNRWNYALDLPQLGDAAASRGEDALARLRLFGGRKVSIPEKKSDLDPTGRRIDVWISIARFSRPDHPALLSQTTDFDDIQPGLGVALVRVITEANAPSNQQAETALLNQSDFLPATVLRLVDQVAELQENSSNRDVDGGCCLDSLLCCDKGK